MDAVPTPPMLCFKSLRANAADVAVASGSIVERLDVFGDIFGRSVSIVVDVLLDSLLLQTAEEGLRHRVVPAVPSTAHAGLEMIGLAEPAPRVTSVLRALIRVDQRSARPPSTHSHQGGIEHELAIDGRASRPTDDSSRVQIQDHRQIQPALPGADIRDICDPNCKPALSNGGGCVNFSVSWPGSLDGSFTVGCMVIFAVEKYRRSIGFESTAIANVQCAVATGVALQRRLRADRHPRLRQGSSPSSREMLVMN